MECCLGEVAGSIENVVVVEMVAGVIESMVMADSGVLLEVVMDGADSLRMDVGDGGSAVMGGEGACVGR